MNCDQCWLDCQELPKDLSVEVGISTPPPPDPKLWVMGLRVRYTLSDGSGNTKLPPSYNKTIGLKYAHYDPQTPPPPVPGGTPSYRKRPPCKNKTHKKKITYIIRKTYGVRFPPMYQPTIDFDVPLANYSPTFESLEARVAAAMAALVDTDNLPDPNEISDEDKDKARDVFSGNALASDADLSSPGMVVYLQSLLAEYDKVVIKSSQQIRTYVTNKLIMESSNADPRIRLKSLEMLGKISDVGLFTDKTEITMRHRPTEELEQMLRERLTKVLEAEVVDNSAKPNKAQIQIDVSDIEAI